MEEVWFYVFSYNEDNGKSNRPSVIAIADFDLRMFTVGFISVSLLLSFLSFWAACKKASGFPWTLTFIAVSLVSTGAVVAAWLTSASHPAVDFFPTIQLTMNSSYNLGNS